MDYIEDLSGVILEKDSSDELSETDDEVKRHQSEHLKLDLRGSVELKSKYYHDSSKGRNDDVCGLVGVPTSLEAKNKCQDQFYSTSPIDRKKSQEEILQLAGLRKLQDSPRTLKIKENYKGKFSTFVSATWKLFKKKIKFKETDHSVNNIEGEFDIKQFQSDKHISEEGTDEDDEEQPLLHKDKEICKGDDITIDQKYETSLLKEKNMFMVDKKCTIDQSHKSNFTMDQNILDDTDDWSTSTKPEVNKDRIEDERFTTRLDKNNKTCDSENEIDLINFQDDLKMSLNEEESISLVVPESSKKVKSNQDRENVDDNEDRYNILKRQLSRGKGKAKPWTYIGVEFPDKIKSATLLSLSEKNVVKKTKEQFANLNKQQR